MLIRNAEIYPLKPLESSGKSATPQLFDVRCQADKISTIAGRLTAVPGETVLDAKGGALLPGLHDHHIHLMALAAVVQSTLCGPPQINNEAQLGQALSQAKGAGWIRGVGYHESVAGMLDHRQLDLLCADRPVRVQHRSGKMWFLNSLAQNLLQLADYTQLDGVETDQAGSPTGRIFRMDQWLGQQLPDEARPDIGPVSTRLAGFGVTGLTDATPRNSSATMAMYQQLLDEGKLLQRICLMGDESIQPVDHDLLTPGCVKIILDDFALPEFDVLKQRIHAAHQQQRCVAIHCVTAVELVFALSALQEAGPLPGDRIEHASVTSMQGLELLNRTPVTVVTQPNFVAERGDQYMNDIDKAEHDYLYRCRSFLDRAIPLGGGTDAPFGNPDPWLAMHAAVTRKTAAGSLLGSMECLSPEQALGLFISRADQPGGAARRIAEGELADICLLKLPWNEARNRLQSSDVAATIRGGEVIFLS